MATINVKMLDMQGEPFAESFTRCLYHADLHFAPARRHSTIKADGSVDLEIEGTGRVLHSSSCRNSGMFGCWRITAVPAIRRPTHPLDFSREAALSMLYHARKVMEKGTFSAECSGHAAAAEDYPGTGQERQVRRAEFAGTLARPLGRRTGGGRARTRTHPDERSTTRLFIRLQRLPLSTCSEYARRFSEVMNYATLPFLPQGAGERGGVIRITRASKRSWGGASRWASPSKGIPSGGDMKPAYRPGLKTLILTRPVNTVNGSCGAAWSGIADVSKSGCAQRGARLGQRPQPDPRPGSGNHAYLLRHGSGCQPAAQLVVNNCLPFGENSADGIVNNGPVYDEVWTPLTYLKAVFDAGIDLM